MWEPLPPEVISGDQVVMRESWMLWMVDRVWRDDPQLRELSFANMAMPDARLEPRVAPKLAAALAHNTQLRVLNLGNANLQAAEGAAIGEALAQNASLEELNLESSFLDAAAIFVIAEGLAGNSTLRRLKLSNLKGLPMGAGAAAEEALARSLEQNRVLTQLGLHVRDPHWRNTINRRILRNVDGLRRSRREGFLRCA